MTPKLHYGEGEESSFSRLNSCLLSVFRSHYHTQKFAWLSLADVTSFYTIVIGGQNAASHDFSMDNLEIYCITILTANHFPEHKPGDKYYPFEAKLWSWIDDCQQEK